MNVDNANEITPLVFLIDCKYCNKKSSQVNNQKIENSEKYDTLYGVFAATIGHSRY